MPRINSGGGRPSDPLASSHVQLHKRGPLVAAELRDLPPCVHRQIGAYIRFLSRESDRDKLSLSSDILGLLNAPAVRAYVLEEWPGCGVARWAAVASAFVAQVRDNASTLLGRYVRDLLGCVASVVAPATRMFRMPRCNDFRLAAHNRRREDLRLSLLGPLAMFFLESVARAEMAWDVLVEPSNAPRRSTHFGWAPSLDSLPAAMRLILLSQAGRRLRSKALLYSPLARYLLELGLVHRVVIADRDDGDPNPTVSTFARHYYAAVLCEKKKGISAGEILGIWLKEGSARWPVPRNINEVISLAPTRFREDWYYISMGLDDYCLTIATGGDNTLSNDTAKARAHFITRAGKLTATAIMGELVPAATSTPNVTKVAATPWFVVRSMLLESERWRKTQIADRRFQDVRARYMHWNMKRASFRAFLTSALNHASKDMGLEEPLVWAFHTKVHSPSDPVVKEYNQARRNAIRFWHYLMTMTWRLDVFRDQLIEGAYKNDVKQFTDNAPYNK